MQLSAFILSSLLSGAALAQTVANYTEPRTGIKFVSVTRGAFNFGISLPKSGGNDLIGHLAGSKSMGWVGGVLGGGMVGPLLLTAWPNGKDVNYSIRKAANKRGSPPVYPGKAKMVTIPDGSYISDNGFSYTFLCKDCLSDPAVAFAPGAADAKFAYAASPQPVPKPAEASTPLTMHTIGMGGFNINLEMAKFDDYSKWAALATGGPAFTAGSAGSSGSGAVAPAAAPIAQAAPAAAPPANASPAAPAPAAGAPVAAAAPVS